MIYCLNQEKISFNKIQDKHPLKRFVITDLIMVHHQELLLFQNLQQLEKNQVHMAKLKSYHQIRYNNENTRRKITVLYSYLSCVTDCSFHLSAWQPGRFQTAVTGLLLQSRFQSVLLLCLLHDIKTSFLMQLHPPAVSI